MRTIASVTTLALASSVLVAGTASTAGAGQSTIGRLRTCAEGSLGYDAHALPPIASSVVLVTVTNLAGSACTIDRFPTVTFAGLDGAAQPVPPVPSGVRRIEAAGKLYAALRTDDRGGAARYVPSLTVAAHPAHVGSTFTASGIGAPTPGIAVSDPITTQWQNGVDEAVGALPG
ncbi:DUF4232 domain-containing protein [Embleya sp. NPDC005575]|uniref:DUF4232 domain-containing protein n=1 Tax=Embleya sp. NPDC005575 TaxID=3156892 RepID=UPI0033AFC773